MTSDVWVFAEQIEGELARSTLEVLGEGQRLASALGGRVTAIVFDSPDVEQSLAHHGADRVYRIVGPPCAPYDPDRFTLTIAGLLAAEPPRLFLCAGTTTGSDLCTRLAVSTGAAIVTGCVAFNVRGERIEAVRAIYNGKVHAAFTLPDSGTALATIVPDVIGVGSPDVHRHAEVTILQRQEPALHTINVLETTSGDPRTLDLTEADVIVSAGRGLGKKENLAVLEELASVLGGSLAGSRVAVDLGWLPRDRQIGQTGKTVAPKLYIACGISGASQHTVGIKQAETIVAINVDDGCGLFKVADLAVHGDVMAVVPALLRRLRPGGVPAH
jgi:electron transfer flavoprotein alpha subunit